MPSEPTNYYLRHIAAAFTELAVPLYAQDKRKVEILLSGRADHYSDFGTAWAPRGAIRWIVEDGIVLSASIGRSIRAPTPTELDQSHNTVVQATLPDTASPTGQANVLVESGSNKELREERAYIKTLGAHVRLSGPASLQWQAALDYFDVRYSGRIQQTALNDPFLSDPRFAGLIERNPSAQDIAKACATGQYFGTTATHCTDSNPTAIVDIRVNNIDTWKTHGIDFAAGLNSDWAPYSLQLKTEGTYYLDFTEIYSPHAPEAVLLNTQANPPRLKLDSTIALSYENFSASTTFNFTNSYRDTASMVTPIVASWTTVDIGLKYVFGGNTRSESGKITVALLAQNVFDKGPPFLQNANAAYQLGHDPENVDPTGRIVGVTISKRW